MVAHGRHGQWAIAAVFGSVWSDGCDLSAAVSCRLITADGALGLTG
jgi:hypothetical protein